jgi:4-amino-4-deoxy-L-arabinose transferase-like glycosyltransferase
MVFQWIWIGFVILLGGQLLSAAPGLEARGPAVWVQWAEILLLFTYVCLTALGLGRRLLRSLQTLTRLEHFLVSLLLGLGLLGDGILGLGLAGFLSPGAIFLWLVLAGLLGSFQWKGIFEEAQEAFQALKQIQFKKWGAFEILLLGTGGSLLILLPILALAPVRDYDALMYHLEIPRQYLLHGRVYFDPGIWRSAYPLLTEMLFSLGIVFHLEAFAQFISLTFALIFFLSVYAFGRRFFDSKTAGLAVGILLGNPAFPIYATSPSIDFSWSSYEFWGIYAFSLWLTADQPQNKRRWLILAGVLSGLAASTKYLSFPTIFILGLLIFWKTIQVEKADVRKLAQNLLFFGVSALIMITPWYLKNWLWTGNPFYPLAFGGPAWTVLRQELYFQDYMGSFGTGTGWLDYVLIPVNLYLAQPRFSTISLEIVHPLLWLAFLFVFVEKKWRQLDYLLPYLAISLILWTASAQVIRFLLPISGFLAVLAAKVLTRFSRVIQQGLSLGLVGALMIVTVLYSGWSVAGASLSGYLSGKRSTSEFLQAEVYDYKTTQFIQAHLPPTDRVLFLWAGQGYYCDARCLPDDDENLAIQLSVEHPAPETLAHQLRLQGVTHLLLGRSNAYWFISFHDPRRRHRAALDYFEKVFLPACAKSLYQDGPLELFALTCK